MKTEKTKLRPVPVQKRWEALKLRPGEVRDAIRALDSSDFFNCPPGELSIVFMGDKDISRVHKEFFGDPEPTDVITFEGDPEMDFAGEICVSVEHALRYSDRHRVDFSRELALYLVHGYLHLSGYDDRDPSARRRMRAAEKKALDLLESSGKFPLFHVVT